jgi:hypothetical protein
MTMMRIFLLAFAVALTPVSALAQEQEVVVRADTPRAEIERILNADNLDTARLSPREALEIMSGIERGRAPEDFWAAYQLHVLAWARLADVVDRVQHQQTESTLAAGLDELAAAEMAIGSTFDEVERIARQYHARLPAPLIDTRTIA